MNGIVDWDRDAPQWLAVLDAAGGGTPPGERATDGLWAIYGPLLGRGGLRPLVLGQLGQSLDGRIATGAGHSRYINGPAAIMHLHRLRALVDAIVIGVGTALADDPRLTVRHAALRRGAPQPARVVIDPHGRLPPDAQCLRDDGARRIVVQAGGRARLPGVEVVAVDACGDGLAPAGILAALRRCGLARILVEGGANTVSRFLSAGCLDRLHVVVAPIIIGDGPVGLTLPPIPTLDAALRPAVCATALPGGDMLFDCALSGTEPTP
ncbi:MAG: RibD family protein [Rhodospirillaceae bacterium]|nr:RibD family protein [Rhodospirillaceae bacterium]